MGAGLRGVRGARGATPRCLPCAAPPLEPPAAGAELESLGHLARGQPTLFLGKDFYAPWYLRETRLSTVPRVVPPGAAPGIYPRRAKRPGPHGGAVDFDSPPDFALARFRYVVTPRTAYASRPPREFQVVQRGRRYLLFRRTAPVVPRRVLEERTAPGAPLDCSLGRPPAGRASVVAWPVFASGRRWRQLDGGRFSMDGPEAVLPPTFTARVRLRLPPGRWRRRVAYRARFDTGARLDGRGFALPAFLGDRFAPLELGAGRAAGARWLSR